MVNINSLMFCLYIFWQKIYILFPSGDLIQTRMILSLSFRLQRQIFILLQGFVEPSERHVFFYNNFYVVFNVGKQYRTENAYDGSPILNLVNLYKDIVVVTRLMHFLCDIVCRQQLKSVIQMHAFLMDRICRAP